MRYTDQDLRDLGIRNGHPYVEWLNLYSAKFGVNTPNRIIAFLMNLLHESGDFYYTEEIASGDAYDTRTDLGNTPQVDGDGRKYKGIL
jgi:predicted chitinase